MVLESNRRREAAASLKQGACALATAVGATIRTALWRAVKAANQDLTDVEVDQALERELVLKVQFFKPV